MCNSHPNQYFVEDIAKKYLGTVESIQHLSPSDNFVWRVMVAGRNYIVKIGPALPYRLRREIRAYEYFDGKALPVPNLICSGESENIPWLILEYCGDLNGQDLFGIKSFASGEEFIYRTLKSLLRLSDNDSDPFLYIKGTVTTWARDRERLATTTSRFGDCDDKQDLFNRIKASFNERSGCLTHRDFSLRQVVVSNGNPIIVDFESIGPGLIERDIGDFLGGICKFGVYQPRYGYTICSFADEHDLDVDLISDYAVYSLLWSISPVTPGQVANDQIGLATRLLQTPNWLTSWGSRTIDMYR